tara:strand:+ start:2201 stop:2491 length:291 start_codon:yes stop_codon:yes gene_type:complete
MVFYLEGQAGAFNKLPIPAQCEILSCIGTVWGSKQPAVLFVAMSKFWLDMISLLTDMSEDRRMQVRVPSSFDSTHFFSALEDNFATFIRYMTVFFH